MGARGVGGADFFFVVTAVTAAGLRPVFTASGRATTLFGRETATGSFFPFRFVDVPAETAWLSFAGTLLPRVGGAGRLELKRVFFFIFRPAEGFVAMGR
jgi:hypothetical protein